jgi:aspartyl/glutamyl-tRNA(Asn/Gln) amidotransferase C subunit
MARIDEQLLNHLCDLARIARENNPARREKLITDLSKILDYFTQLQEIDTDTVVPLAGGSSEINVWREDKEIIRDGKDASTPEELRSQFPESQQSHLKVPPVFEQ